MSSTLLSDTRFTLASISRFAGYEDRVRIIRPAQQRRPVPLFFRRGVDRGHRGSPSPAPALGGGSTARAGSLTSAGATGATGAMTTTLVAATMGGATTGGGLTTGCVGATTGGVGVGTCSG